MAIVIKAKSKRALQAEKKARAEAEGRHERAVCAIQIATTFLERYAVEHPPIKVINPIDPAHPINPRLTAESFPSKEEFDK